MTKILSYNEIINILWMDEENQIIAKPIGRGVEDVILIFHNDDIICYLKDREYFASVPASHIWHKFKFEVIDSINFLVRTINKSEK